MVLVVDKPSLRQTREPTGTQDAERKPRRSPAKHNLNSPKSLSPSLSRSSTSGSLDQSQYDSGAVETSAEDIRPQQGILGALTSTIAKLSPHQAVRGRANKDQRPLPPGRKPHSSSKAQKSDTTTLKPGNRKFRKNPLRRRIQPIEGHITTYQDHSLQVRPILWHPAASIRNKTRRQSRAPAVESP